MKKYVIGIDYGTLSARCLLVDAKTGEECAQSVYVYPHGVMDERLPSGEKLTDNFALQHPQDYLGALKTGVFSVLEAAGVSAEDVLGIGIDFTACTILPTNKEGMPLCMLDEFSSNPHAYVKLWKHHAAQPEADEINALAEKRGESWLESYGGKISCEWALPKILETLRCAEDVYNATDRFYEAADWLSLMLTGEETHSAAFAGYKALWNAKDGYPSNDFFTALDERLDGIVGTKLSERVLGMDKIAGRINKRGAELTGLKEGTPVALPMIDAHAAMPALGITADGELMIILGTSACHILNAKEEKCVNGICGYVRDGVIPGLTTYEAGQAAVGDIFDWFVKNSVPASYEKEAADRGIGIHKLLREKAKTISPKDTKLIALDWLNGNRSILVNSSLTGVITGLTLATKPEEIYRAWIESTAYGLRVILEQFESYGIHVGRIVAAGGIANKDEMMMQIYSDVLGRKIEVAKTTQAGALGSAIYAACAAGVYDSVTEAADSLAQKEVTVYMPIEENVLAYNELYTKYRKLHDYFGKSANA